MPADAIAPSLLIDGQFQVDLATTLHGGGGLEAFAVLDRHGAATDLMAILSRPTAPSRATALAALLGQSIDHLLVPLAHGPAPAPGGTEGWFVISRAPGPAIWPALRPWSEADLLNLVLRPAAQALDRLQTRRVTHRAIRPDNIFQARAGEPVTLGSAWSAPAASLQPAAFEPPYVTACPPSARGEGAIADDIYALGVTLLCLATGTLPLPGLDDTGVVARKLEKGSLSALLSGARLSPTLTDLLAGMLADDPDHRPTPAMLVDPAVARSRRIAPRPARRAQQPIEMGAQTVWTTRQLAHAMAAAPAHAIRMLRSGAVDTWVRRSLGDSPLATRCEEIIRQRAERRDSAADPLLLMRAVAVFDPLAPLCWTGIALWPDGLGGALADADPALRENLAELIDAEAIAHWGAMRPTRGDAARLRTDAGQFRHLLRQRGLGGGLPALRYLLNPLLPCASPALAGRIVARKQDLLPALDAAAQHPETRRLPPIDAEIGGFLSARQEPSVLADLAQLATAEPGRLGLLHLRILAGLQHRLKAPALPHLAAWLVEHASPALAVWQSRTRRNQIAEALPQRAAAGQLAALLALFEDPDARAADAQEAAAATSIAHAIDSELAALMHDVATRPAYAARVGQELATSVALIALTGSLVLLAVG